jgi:hypothetical protein
MNTKDLDVALDQNENLTSSSVYKKKRNPRRNFCTVFLFKFLPGGFITSVPDAAFNKWIFFLELWTQFFYLMIIERERKAVGYNNTCILHRFSFFLNTL